MAETPVTCSICGKQYPSNTYHECGQPLLHDMVFDLRKELSACRSQVAQMREALLAIREDVFKDGRVSGRNQRLAEAALASSAPLAETREP